MAQFTADIFISSDDGLSWGPSDTDGSGFFTIGVDWVGMGLSGGNHYQAGLRFRNVTIPSGSTITSAFLGVIGYLTNPGPQYNLKITAEDVDNPGIWTTNHRPGTGGAPGRGPETTAKVDWDPTSIAPGPTRTNTPDISAIIQELIDRLGWSSGNAMCFIIRNDGGTILARVYDRNFTTFRWEARVTINYTPGPGQVMIFS